MKAKNNFLRKFIPLVKPALEFAQEGDATVRRANTAEEVARKAVQAELSALREENRALREQNLDLTSLA